MFKGINNLEGKKIVTEVLQMSISNMLNFWASAGAEVKLTKRWLREILNFCKILFVLILVKIETQEQKKTSSVLCSKTFCLCWVAEFRLLRSLAFAFRSTEVSERPVRTMGSKRNTRKKSFP